MGKMNESVKDRRGWRIIRTRQELITENKIRVGLSENPLHILNSYRVEEKEYNKIGKSKMQNISRQSFLILSLTYFAFTIRSTNFVSC